MERNWLDKLQACKDFDNNQKAELRGRLLALQCAGTDPNVTMMGDDEDIRQCLAVLLHAPAKASKLHLWLSSSHVGSHVGRRHLHLLNHQRSDALLLALHELPMLCIKVPILRGLSFGDAVHCPCHEAL